MESQPGECTDAGNGRERCKWIEHFLVLDDECLACGHLKRGVEYKLRVRLINKVYVDAFGGQQTATVTFRAGDEFRREVSEQSSTPPRSRGGKFAGIYAWGAGASRCGRVESSSVLRFHCDRIERNVVGSFVLIRFPNHNFRVVVQLAKDQDPRRGLAWTDRTTAAIPIVERRGVIEGSDTVTLAGRSVGYFEPWDLGLDAYPFRSSGPRVVNAEITITRR
jgi:hypothetical protein